MEWWHAPFGALVAPTAGGVGFALWRLAQRFVRWVHMSRHRAFVAAVADVVNPQMRELHDCVGRRADRTDAKVDAVDRKLTGYIEERAVLIEEFRAVDDGLAARIERLERA